MARTGWAPRGLAAAMTLAGALVSTSALAEQFKCPKVGGDFVFGQEANVNSLDQMTSTTISTRNVAMNIFESLMARDENNNPITDLAESYTESPDGLVYTFKLRPGVKFHNGKAMTSADVVASWDRYKRVASERQILDNVEKWEAPDASTFVVTMKKRQPTFIEFISSFSQPIVIVPAELKDDPPQQLKTIGTGPFQLVDYQKDAVIRYKANPDYWAEPAKIDNLVFAITPDPSVRYQKLKAGECQVMAYPNPADIPAMKEDSAVNLMSSEGLNIGYHAYNAEKKPFDDPRVRKALNMAVNKQAIIDAVFQGAGTAAKNPIPPTMWSYNNAVQDDPYDPEAAKKLLAEAGASGLKTNIWAMPVQRPYNPNAKRMAEMIQADWKAVGVDAEIVSYEWGEYLKRSSAGEHETVLLGWTGDNGDPDNFLFALLSCEAVKGGNNRARWCNQEFNDLVVKAQRSSDLAERTKLYEEAQVVFKREAPWNTIAHSVVYQPLAKNVVDYKIDPFGAHIFYGVDLEG